MSIIQEIKNAMPVEFTQVAYNSSTHYLCKYNVNDNKCITVDFAKQENLIVDTSVKFKNDITGNTETISHNTSYDMDKFTVKDVINNVIKLVNEY